MRLRLLHSCRSCGKDSCIWGITERAQLANARGAESKKNSNRKVSRRRKHEWRCSREAAQGRNWPGGAARGLARRDPQAESVLDGRLRPGSQEQQDDPRWGDVSEELAGRLPASDVGAEFNATSVCQGCTRLPCCPHCVEKMGPRTGRPTRCHSRSVSDATPRTRFFLRRPDSSVPHIVHVMRLATILADRFSESHFEIRAAGRAERRHSRGMTLAAVAGDSSTWEVRRRRREKPHVRPSHGGGGNRPTIYSRIGPLRLVN